MSDNGCTSGREFSEVLQGIAEDGQPVSEEREGAAEPPGAMTTLPGVLLMALAPPAPSCDARPPAPGEAEGVTEGVRSWDGALSRRAWTAPPEGVSSSAGTLPARATAPSLAAPPGVPATTASPPEAAEGGGGAQAGPPGARVELELSPEPRFPWKLGLPQSVAGEPAPWGPLPPETGRRGARPPLDATRRAVRTLAPGDVPPGAPGGEDIGEAARPGRFLIVAGDEAASPIARPPGRASPARLETEGHEDLEQVPVAVRIVREDAPPVPRSGAPVSFPQPPWEMSGPGPGPEVTPAQVPAQPERLATVPVQRDAVAPRSPVAGDDGGPGDRAARPDGFAHASVPHDASGEAQAPPVEPVTGESRELPPEGRPSQDREAVEKAPGDERPAIREREPSPVTSRAPGPTVDHMEGFASPVSRTGSEDLRTGTTDRPVDAVARAVARWISEHQAVGESRRAGVVRATLGPEGTELRLQLHPPELGELRLQLATEGGRLMVHVTAHNPDTGQMLQHQAGDLARSLEQAGIQLAGFSVDVGTGPHGHAQRPAWPAEKAASSFGGVTSHPRDVQGPSAGSAWVRLGMAAVDLRV